MLAYASRTGRAATRTGKGGAHWWRSDPYHLSADGKQTLCGRSVADWIKFDETPPNHRTDAHACAKCRGSRHFL